ncbi:MAG: ABC transporter permease [Bryobacterales bacterium]|nr:ABC transporter permease [Bryobacterales bacterium]
MQHTFRRLARTPGFTLATILTLALGIGANTAIFSVIHGVLLKPLPYREPGRLIGVWQTAPGVNIKDLNASLADYFTYREESKTFEDVAIWSGRSYSVTEFAEPERVDGFGLTYRLLPMLGVQPALGRHFEEKDNKEGSPETMMISHAYWQRRFGGDPKVIGRRIQVDGVAREIIGVLPADFWFLDRQHEVLLPFVFDRAKIRLAGYNFMAVARLRPGVTLEQANADVGRMIGIELERFPPPNGMSRKMMDDARLGPAVRWWKDELLGDIGKSLWVVMATIGMVLLIACANVANLLLVRAEGRAQELAVRAALGAGRGRIARELLMESQTLALAGGLLGIGFAIGVVKLVIAMSPARLPRLEQVTVEGMPLLFTLVVSVLAGFAFGAIPVLKQKGLRLAEALRGSGRNTSASRERHYARNTLTVVQVALALVLLVGSGLMIRTFQSMRNVNPGFTGAESLQTLRISIPRSVTTKDEEIRRLQQQLRDKLAEVPGVTAVSLMNGLPMTGYSSQDPIMARDHTYRENQIPPLRRFVYVGPGAFQALGTPLLAGREYRWDEALPRRHVVIISDNFAREYWGSAQAAIGKQIRESPNEPWHEIIGVVADLRQDGVEKKAPSSVYWSLRGHNSMTFLVRSTRAGTESLTAELRRAVWEVNRNLPVTEMRTMREVYEKSMARTAFTLTLLGISGVMALLLAAVGIYAVISYTVTQSRREIGIRLALGAPQAAVKMKFVRNGLYWGGVGVAFGLAAAGGLSRLMTAILFEISPLDPLTYVGVSVAILGMAAIASYLPARRVARVDPMEALRAD